MSGRKTISSELLDYFKEWLVLTQPILTANQLAQQFGIHVEMTEKSPKRGNLILRSEYSGNPPTIIVYRESVSTWWNQLQTMYPKLNISQQQLMEICIFHEICHHMLVYPTCFFPQSHIKDIKRIKRSEEESLIQSLVREWIICRFPDYNTHTKEILET